MNNSPNKNPNENSPIIKKSDELNEKLMKIIGYKNFPEKELQDHLNLIKKWLKEYNQFEYDNQSIGKFTKYIKKVEEIKIVLNHKLNFCHTKLFIDFLELKIRCPSFASEFRTNFIQYISYVNGLVRRILISSKKILEDTSVFNDLILFNYPYNYSYNNSNNNYYELLKSKKGIISFSKCFVVQVNSPIFLLWGKKEYPSCKCEFENEQKKFSNKKYFNIYSNNLKNNSNFSRPSICHKCGKVFFHDTKGDIYIQSQEIKLVIDCNNSLLPNVINVWAFGDLIDSVQEGDCITLNAFHVPEKMNVFEKNYTNGYFVALNYDKYFNNLYLLRPGDFKLNLNNAENNLAEKLKKINLKDNMNKNNLNFNDSFNNEDEDKINEDDLEQILQSLKFQRQTCQSFYKLIIQNYINFKQKELNHLDLGLINNINDVPIISPKINEIHYPFINIILDLSITQRDYYNHHVKLCFFENCLEDKENKDNSKEKDPLNIINGNNIYKKKEIEKDVDNEDNCLKDITQSRNVLFKKNIYNKIDNNKNIEFNNTNNMNAKNKIYTNNNNRKRLNTYMSNKSDQTEVSIIKSTLDLDIKNYFELSHQINNVSTLSNDLLTKPLHLFLIFDSVKNDPLFNNIILKYATKLYSSLIVIFPIHNQIKWTQTELINYFFSHNNSIILIPDIELLSKTEIDIINNIMNYNNSSLNITFWFCCSYHLLYESNSNANKKNKNKNSASGFVVNNLNMNNYKIKIKNFEQILEKCEIIMNYSIRNFKFMNNIDIINENSIINFLIDSNETEIKEEKILDFYYYSEFIHNKLNISCNKTHLYTNYENSSLNASKIIEKYFIMKRNVSKINFDDLFTLLRLSIFTSMLRFHYENKKILLPITICNMSYIDSLYAILIYEHVSQYKYGLEYKIMGNVTESLMFQDYNQIIDEIMNNIVVEDQNKNINNNAYNVNINKNKNNNDSFNFDNNNDNEFIPSKSLYSKRIKLNDKNSNIFDVDCVFNDNNIFNDYDMKKNKNKENECILCKQINNLNVKNKKYLIDYINKLNEFILKDFDE